MEFVKTGNTLRRIFACLGWLWACAGFAAVTSSSTPVLPDPPPGISVGNVQVMEDPSGHAELGSIVERRADFRDVSVRIPDFHFTASAYWFRIPLQNISDHEAPLFLNINHPTLDYLTLYTVHAGGQIDIVRSGDRMPLRDRPFSGTSLALPFTLGPGESSDLYLRVRSDAGSLMVPMEIVTAATLRSETLSGHFVHGIMLGLFGALFIYNLAVFCFLRRLTYLYYVAYLLGAYLTITSLDGFGGAVLYPQNTWMGNEGLPLFSGFTFSMILLFTRAFLDTREAPRLDRWIKLLVSSAVVLGFSPFVLPIGVSYQFDIVMVFAFPVLCTAAGFVMWKRGHKEARFYILGQAASWIGLLAFGAMETGIFPYSLLLFESIGIGISLDALLLSVALADHIRQMRLARESAEADSRRLLEGRSAELERIVAQRTADLDAARCRAETLATTDPLTGMLNRRGLLGLAERDLGIALRHGQPLSVLVFDVDHFKRVNDTYGHLQGDAVLRALSGTARSAVRSTDLLGRMGGEEFILVMPNTTCSEAAIAAERLRAAIEAAVSVGSPPVPVTASFGVSTLTPECRTLDALHSSADAALYVAKRRGRNCVVAPGCERALAGQA